MTHAHKHIKYTFTKDWSPQSLPRLTPVRLITHRLKNWNHHSCPYRLYCHGRVATTLAQHKRTCTVHCIFSCIYLLFISLFQILFFVFFFFFLKHLTFLVMCKNRHICALRTKQKVFVQQTYSHSFHWLFYFIYCLLVFSQIYYFLTSALVYI